MESKLEVDLHRTAEALRVAYESLDAVCTAQRNTSALDSAWGAVAANARGTFAHVAVCEEAHRMAVVAWTNR